MVLGVFPRVQRAAEEKESVESFIAFWRALARNMKDDTVTSKELTKAVKTLPGGAKRAHRQAGRPGGVIKMARVRTLQSLGIEAIDFAHFLQVMKAKNSELGDGAEFLSESDVNSPGPSPHGHLLSPSRLACQEVLRGGACVR